MIGSTELLTNFEALNDKGRNMLIKISKGLLANEDLIKLSGCTERLVEVKIKGTSKKMYFRVLEN